MTRLTSEIWARQGRLKTVRPDRPRSSYTGTRSSTAWRWRFSRQATSPGTACTQSASADDRAGINLVRQDGPSDGRDGGLDVYPPDAADVQLGPPWQQGT